jgi:endonuclease/exonuclease/phosphatase family metal-dependent hydrolase
MKSIKFLSLNLYEGGLLFDNVLKFLKQENPDIIAFQEVYNSHDKNLSQQLRSVEVLSKNLQGFEHFFAPEFIALQAEGKIELGNAIFSKFPISSTSYQDFGITFGEYDIHPPGGDYGLHPANIQSCEIDVNGEVFNICNLHGIWGLDGGDTPERFKMSQVIIDQIKDKQRVILAGDFNVKPNTKTIANIEQHLTNLFKDELTTSFNLKRKDLEKFPGYATAVVDMIFVSQDILVTSHYSPPVDVSDHLPLVCEIMIK